MKDKQKNVLAAILAALSLAASPLGAYAQNSVGVQFNDNAASALLATETAGVSPYAQANWNTLGHWGSGGTLTNSAGVATTLFMNWDSGYASSQGTASLGPDGKLMDGFMASWDSGRPCPPLSTSIYGTNMKDKPLIYLRDLSDWYSSQGAEGYAIVLYVGGENYWEKGETWIQAVSGDPANSTMVAEADLTSHQFYQKQSTFSGTYNKVSPTSTEATATGNGNYAVFTGLTNDAIIIHDLSIGYGVGISGFQIVPIYPSAPIANTPTIAPSATVYPGTAVTFTEVPDVDPFNPACSYQWQAIGSVTNKILNATNSTYVVTPTNSTTPYTLSYNVIVSNGIGSSTSSIVTLNVNGGVAPFLVTDTRPGPGSGAATVYAYTGGQVSFSAVFDGSLPISYKWQYDSGSGTYVDIAGATNATLTLTNTGMLPGSYRLSAQNAYGSAMSTGATLALMAVPPALTPSQPYAYTLLTNNPVGYWRLSETIDPYFDSVQAYDYSGHNLPATYGGGTYDNIPGPVFAGFEPSNTGASMENGVLDAYLSVPSLDLKTNAVTISMWIKPHIIGTYWGLFMWRGANGDAAGLGFDNHQNGSTVGLGYNWNTNNSVAYNYQSGLEPVIDAWSFVNLVITPTNTTFYLYSDIGGVPSLQKAVQTVNNGPESFSGGTIRIGSDNYDGRNFTGSIDEVAVFNRSLSEAEVQNLFLKAINLAGIAPNITTNPASVTTYEGQPVQFTATADAVPAPSCRWQGAPSASGPWSDLSDGSQFSGVTTTVLTVANALPTDPIAYRLHASNNVGAADSTPAALTLTPVPHNGQWTVNFHAFQVGANDGSTTYSGHGVLGAGTYWNTCSGYPLATVANTLRDDGTTPSGITLGTTNNVGGWASDPPRNNLLFDEFSNSGSTNGQVYIFANVPNGIYNLALFSCNGVWADRATDFTVNGVLKSAVHLQDKLFVDGENTVLYTGVTVTNGTISVLAMPAPSTKQPANAEVDFNGAQLQMVSLSTPPVVTVEKSWNGSQLSLSWSQGTLLEAPSVTGPWTTNMASSPFVLTPSPSTPAKFYRVRVQ